ncbi:hypothetical protein [Micromonospora sp. NPDC050495]|uniref:hypothetical protein n=1 Tax=Micromonospora sp. NPDC050495 TaxID=3154936 RepID=UPI0033C9E7AB
MAGTDWAVVAAGLGGTVLGSVLQWVQTANQARRERKREANAWSREDRRSWADKRQSIYLDTVATIDDLRSSLRSDLDPWIMKPLVTDLKPEGEPQWHEPAGPAANWRRHMAEIQFYGSEPVQAAAMRLDRTFNLLELGIFKIDPGRTLRFVQQLSEDLVAAMRTDLGLTAGEGKDPIPTENQMVGEFMREVVRRSNE